MGKKDQAETFDVLLQRCMDGDDAMWFAEDAHGMQGPRIFFTQNIARTLETAVSKRWELSSVAAPFSTMPDYVLPAVYMTLSRSRERLIALRKTVESVSASQAVTEETIKKLRRALFVLGYYHTNSPIHCTKPIDGVGDKEAGIMALWQSAALGDPLALYYFAEYQLSLIQSNSYRYDKQARLGICNLYYYASQNGSSPAINRLSHLLCTTRDFETWGDSYALRILFDSIFVMRDYGRQLADQDSAKSKVVHDLSDSLLDKVNSLYLRNPGKKITEEDINLFKQDFIRQLHSQDKLLQEHISLWKPIVANILIALTGVGLLAIIGKVVVEAVHAHREQRSMSFNKALFFAKTTPQKCVEAIDDALQDHRWDRMKGL